MEAPANQISVRSSYNLAGCSFAPEEISQEIKKNIPDFKIDYAPDFRQAIADSWPKSIDDSFAQKDWGWKPTFTLEKMVADMLENIKTLVS
jgi:nucleoside-diphosphate-sugar epimerase